MKRKLIEVALPLEAISKASAGEHRPFQTPPDFGATSVNYDLAELLARAERPA